MAPFLYFAAGVFAGASWTLIGYTVARALAPRSRRIAGVVALATLVGDVLPLIVNRPRHTPFGVLLGGLLGLVLLGLGGAAGDTSRALDPPALPAPKGWADPDTSDPVGDVRRALTQARTRALGR